MTTHEVTWSAFLREPSSVESLLDEGDVVLKRRDGEPLRLSREPKREAGHDALAAAARLLAPVLSDEARRSIEAKAGTQLPWTRFLPENERRLFLREFLSQFEACADLGDFTPLGNLLVQWKNTASLYAEGLADELKRPVKAVGPRLARPRGR